MHPTTPKHTEATRKPERLSGSWCISGLCSLMPVRGSLATLFYPAFPKLARNQETDT
jgi:hypothetical protein